MQLLGEKDTLTQRSTELATENRLRRGLAGFAERVAASLDDLDHEARQRLLRLIVEKVRVTGWRVEIHLKIPLADDGPDEDHRPPGNPDPEPPPSNDMGLRSLRANQRTQLPNEAPPSTPGPAPRRPEQTLRAPLRPAAVAHEIRWHAPQGPIRPLTPDALPTDAI